MTPDELLAAVQRLAAALRQAVELLDAAQTPPPSLARAAEREIAAITLDARGGPGWERLELN